MPCLYEGKKTVKYHRIVIAGLTRNPIIYNTYRITGVFASLSYEDVRALPLRKIFLLLLTLRTLCLCEKFFFLFRHFYGSKISISISIFFFVLSAFICLNLRFFFCLNLRKSASSNSSALICGKIFLFLIQPIAGEKQAHILYSLPEYPPEKI